LRKEIKTKIDELLHDDDKRRFFMYQISKYFEDFDFLSNFKGD
jgi:hypothetical protein